ncbi:MULTISPECIES: rhodanese-like domain-containing protein [unclassified Arthrobacter]|uniref:rhodanese-like domain-containing protein n=1 Tax=unclassified Arthrobacter TaxID=235627 RepID=UPI002106CA05|nr:MULTISPECIES: rhodanese-like domain-containing protein [unclassified Arthrobacter]MCQ1946125.1 rhodanese-like domain-containing protein [Arthrobacter sp. zg-Y1116]MCQ1986063.1 rhodanese-like domain-containing protein [Arthrobacter sp. zg-Y844]MCQ1994194.1 rhodanese-like domain-containing protein [Arthrobacter sp. zg-Y1171]UWX81706.1 rhodanese-like domain-containing protein [Arthrobacter sp. zg-Y1171]
MASSASPVTELDAATLQNWMGRHEDLVILDVRSAAEFESMHIRGSYNVPLPLLSEHTDELATRLGDRVVLVCQSGVRAEQARGRLSGTGINTAQVLTGGVPAFAAAGGDVVRGAQRWSLERQVRMAAGSLVIAGLAGGRFVSPKVRLLAGGIGAGLTFSAATNTCAMGQALSKMPWNKAASEPTAESAISALPAKR